MDSNNFSKGLRNSLKFLDNEFVYWIIVIILFLYNTCIFMNINDFFSNMYEFGIVRVIVLLLILYVSQKSYLIALLLAMSYLLSVKFNKENFESMMNNQDSMHNSEYEEDSNKHKDKHHSEEMEKYNNNMIDSSAMDFNAEDQKMGVTNQFSDKTSDEMEGFNNNLFVSRSMDFTEEDQDMGVNNQFGDSKVKETFSSEESSGSMMNNSLNKTECLQNYHPKHQTVGNLCQPVATFEGEFNAQGLNYPIGFNMK
jgi:hypothetical protein